MSELLTKFNVMLVIEQDRILEDLSRISNNWELSNKLSRVIECKTEADVIKFAEIAKNCGFNVRVVVDNLGFFEPATFKLLTFCEFLPLLQNPQSITELLVYPDETMAYLWETYCQEINSVVSEASFEGIRFSVKDVNTIKVIINSFISELFEELSLEDSALGLPLKAHNSSITALELQKHGRLFSQDIDGKTVEWNINTLQKVSSIESTLLSSGLPFIQLENGNVLFGHKGGQIYCWNTPAANRIMSFREALLKVIHDMTYDKPDCIVIPFPKEKVCRSLPSTESAKQIVNFSTSKGSSLPKETIVLESISHFGKLGCRIRHLSNKEVSIIFKTNDAKFAGKIFKFCFVDLDGSEFSSHEIEFNSQAVDIKFRSKYSAEWSGILNVELLSQINLYVVKR